MNTPKTRTRYSVVAAGLSFLIIGLGHLYVGRARRILIPIGVFVFVILLLAFLGQLSRFHGMWIYLGLFVALVIFGIVDSAVIAHRTHSFDAKWYNRWTVYVAWFFLLTLFWNMFPIIRESVLGVEIYRIPSDSMAPTVRRGEIILVNTRAFDRKEPSIGDVIAVNSPSTGQAYVRRISGFPTPSSVALGRDNINGAPGPDLPTVPLSEVIGQVTDIFFSRDPARMGKHVR